MKKVILALVTILALSAGRLHAQGINFQISLTWDEALAKAKAEHKYIFVNCYATWCGPCKQMDSEVYPTKAVGDVYNAQFICVRLQMDKTREDDDEVKKQYRLADQLKSYYAVNAFPTFLFFDETGNPVHKVVGYRNPEQFIGLAADAKNPDKQYYSVLKNFQPGKLDTADEKGLALSLLYVDAELGGKIASDYLNRIPKENLSNFSNGELMVQYQDDPAVLGIAINFIQGNTADGKIKEYVVDFTAALTRQPKIQQWAESYIANAAMADEANQQLAELFPDDPKTKLIANRYIDRLSDAQLYKKSSIIFIKTFTDTSAGKGFDLFYRHQAKVDTVMHDKNYAQSVISVMVANELVNPVIEAAKRNGIEPDWKQVSSSILTKFGTTYVNDNIVRAKIHWYKFKKDGPNYAKYLVQKMDKEFKENGMPSEGIGRGFYWNNYVYDVIFQYDENKQDLQKAATWMKKLNETGKSPNSATLDTEANVLYKLGRTEEAIKMETEAAQLSPKDKGIAVALQKMKAGQPTWSLTGMQ